MNEYIAILVNFIGIFLGAFLAYTSTMKIERRKKLDRLKVVIPIISEDLKRHILDLDTAISFASNYKRIYDKLGESDPEKVEKYNHQLDRIRERIQHWLEFRKDLFVALLDDVLLLETETALKIINSYKHLEKNKNNLYQSFSSENWDRKWEETSSKVESSKQHITELLKVLEKYQ